MDETSGVMLIGASVIAMGLGLNVVFDAPMHSSLFFIWILGAGAVASGLLLKLLDRVHKE